MSTLDELRKLRGEMIADADGGTADYAMHPLLDYTIALAEAAEAAHADALKANDYYEYASTTAQVVDALRAALDAEIEAL